MTNNIQNKLIPSLWFGNTQGNISEIICYYKNVFEEHFVSGNITDLGETPSGKTQLCEVEIFGQKYSLMSTEQKHDEFNDAFAITIICEDQNEIDKYWNYFTKDGSEVQCGWCIDKYGLRWQVVPNNLGELLATPNGWNVMMNQKKIIISEYL